MIEPPRSTSIIHKFNLNPRIHSPRFLIQLRWGVLILVSNRSKNEFPRIWTITHTAIPIKPTWKFYESQTKRGKRKIIGIILLPCVILISSKIINVMCLFCLYWKYGTKTELGANVTLNMYKYHRTGSMAVDVITMKLPRLERFHNIRFSPLPYPGLVSFFI